RNVAARLQLYDFVDDVRYGEEWIAQLYRLRNIAGIVGMGLGLAFATVAIIIIGATMRMAMLSRAKEISVMQLVQHYLHFRTVFFDGRTALVGVLVGMVIGLFGSALSVGRHLRAG